MLDRASSRDNSSGSPRKAAVVRPRIRIPDVEEVEPLRRVPAAGVPRERRPGAEGLLASPARGDGQRLRHRHRVAIVGDRACGTAERAEAARARARMKGSQAEIAPGGRRTERGRPSGCPAPGRPGPRRPRPQQSAATSWSRTMGRSAGTRARAVAVRRRAQRLEHQTFLLGHHHMDEPRRAEGEGTSRPSPSCPRARSARIMPDPRARLAAAVLRVMLTVAVRRVEGLSVGGDEVAGAPSESRKTPTVSSSSRAPMAPVITWRVDRTTARSAGKSRRATRPTVRASPSRAGRGRQPIAAARR